MGASFAFTTVLEITAVLFLVWGFANEDKFIEFEDKCAWIIATYIKKIQKKKSIKKLTQKNCNANLHSITNKNIQSVTRDTSNEVA